MKFLKPVTTRYKLLNKKETEQGIKLIKDTFQKLLSDSLKLRRITAPLFVKSDTGLNDDLNGIEQPVSFNIKDFNNQKVEIVHSLAKWKRIALKNYNIKEHRGIYTDMNAIRPDEELDNLHSIYVDQWDWEMVINDKDRTDKFLEYIVRKIYNCIKLTDDAVRNNFSVFDNLCELPNDITFISSEELYNKYPNNSAKEREYLITKEHNAVFIKNIGNKLSNGEKHDNRAPDYDDWNLNGDILLWDFDLQCPIEISSMGIRVNKERLDIQMKETGKPYKYYHNHLEELPLSIGGGIGQSRLCMYLLHKAHIGEIQSSIWSDDMINICKENDIELL